MGLLPASPLLAVGAAAEMEHSIFRILTGDVKGGLPKGALTDDPRYEKLREMELDVSTRTGIPISQVEEAYFGGTSLGQPLPFDERMKLMETLSGPAALEQLRKSNTSFPEAVESPVLRIK